MTFAHIDVQFSEDVSLHPSIFWRHLLQKWPDNLRLGVEHVVRKESDCWGEACFMRGDSDNENMFERVKGSSAPILSLGAHIAINQCKGGVGWVGIVYSQDRGV